jgi:hypothetical protein
VPKITRCRQWALGLGLMGSGVGLMVVALGFSAGNLAAPARVLLLSAGALVGWFLVARVALAGVRVSDGGVLVRNPFVNRFVPWGEIREFGLGRYGVFSRMGSVTLLNGSRLPLFGIQAVESMFNPGDRQAHEIVARLNAELAARA